MAQKQPWFPFYAGDWLLDEKVGAMSLEARGAYLHLLCLQWREGSVPSDPAQLARLLGLPAKGSQFSRVWEALKDHFGDANGMVGRLTNPRLERIREEQIAYLTRKSEASRKANGVRWDSNRTPVGSNSESLAKSESESKQTTTKRSAPLALPDWLPPELWSAFLEHRKKLKAPMTEHAQALMFKDLEQAFPIVEARLARIREGMVRGWKGLVFPDDRSNARASQRPASAPPPVVEATG